MDKEDKDGVSKGASGDALEKQIERISRFFDEQLNTIEREKEALERMLEYAQDNPVAALSDKSLHRLSIAGKQLQELKSRFEIGFRNLLLAHAGGAVIVINLIPDIVDNKVLIQLAANALNNFAWGVVLLLLSAMSHFIAGYSNFIQSIMKVVGIRSDWFTGTDFASPLYIAASIFILISLFLFASALLSAASALGNLG